MVKNLPANAGDAGPIPGLGRSPVEGNDYPLQRSRLEILWTEEADGLQSMRSQKSWTQLSNNNKNMEQRGSQSEHPRGSRSEHPRGPQTQQRGGVMVL